VTGGGGCVGGLAAARRGACLSGVGECVSAGLGVGECVVLGVGVGVSALSDVGFDVRAASGGAPELLELCVPATSVEPEAGLPSVIAGGLLLGAECACPLGTGAVGSVELVAERARASSARSMV
jgi:hypothetical protein